MSQKSLLSKEDTAKKLVDLLIESQKELLRKEKKFNGVREFYGYDANKEDYEEDSVDEIDRQKSMSSKLRKAASPFGSSRNLKQYNSGRTIPEDGDEWEAYDPQKFKDNYIRPEDT